jgi:hypothetical protein
MIVSTCLPVAQMQICNAKNRLEGKNIRDLELEGCSDVHSDIFLVLAEKLQSPILLKTTSQHCEAAER